MPNKLLHNHSEIPLAKMKASFTTTILSSLAAIGSVAANPLRPLGDLVKRNPDGNFTLYAYGLASEPVKLFYADGKATPHHTTIINTD